MHKKLEFLQIGRGVAALIVVLHHITAAGIFYLNFTLWGGIFEVGWNGVDFFFVLSGFIIYYIHSKDLGKPLEWKRYFAKRLIRIYPIYWVIAIISLIFLIIGDGNISDSSLSGNLLKSSYVIKSLLLIPQKISPFLRVAWSLCYEMFFYIMFGFCILLGRKTIFIFAAFYLILLCSQLFHLFSFENSSVLSFFSSNYNLEFLIGIFAAWCFKSFESRRSDLLARKWIIGLFLVAGILIFSVAWLCSLRFQANFNKFSIYNRLLYGISSALIIFSIANLKLKRENRVTGFFLLLGDASFVLYLIHPLILAVIFKLLLKIGLPREGLSMDYGICLLSLLICVSVGILFHKRVETVILNFLNLRVLSSSGSGSRSPSSTKRSK
jgi:peptidoglycan/LPS O-acetylase OafA/YrhL